MYCVTYPYFYLKTKWVIKGENFHTITFGMEGILYTYRESYSTNIVNKSEGSKFYSVYKYTEFELYES